MDAAGNIPERWQPAAALCKAHQSRYFHSVGQVSLCLRPGQGRALSSLVFFVMINYASRWLPLSLLAMLATAYATTLAPGLSWANDGADGGDLITAAAT